jgi:hypothetical protein
MHFKKKTKNPKEVFQHALKDKGLWKIQDQDWNYRLG